MNWKAVLAWAAGGTGTIVVSGLLLWLLIATIEQKKAPDVSVPVMPAPELARAPQKAVGIKAPVKVYAGDTKARLKLPDDVIKSETQQVIAATQVRQSERPQTITTTIDTQTGESRSFVRQDAYPWFAIETRGEARLVLGYRFSKGEALPKQIVRLGIGYDVLRVKALTAGLTGTIDSDGQTFIGVGVAYRW